MCKRVEKIRATLLAMTGAACGSMTLPAAAASFTPGNIFAVGDSYTEEYQTNNGRNQHGSWTELLDRWYDNNDSGLDFGNPGGDSNPFGFFSNSNYEYVDNAYYGPAGFGTPVGFGVGEDDYQRGRFFEFNFAKSGSSYDEALPDPWLTSLTSNGGNRTIGAPPPDEAPFNNDGVEDFFPSGSGGSGDPFQNQTIARTSGDQGDQQYLVNHFLQSNDIGASTPITEVIFLGANDLDETDPVAQAAQRADVVQRSQAMVDEAFAAAAVGGRSDFNVIITNVMDVNLWPVHQNRTAQEIADSRAETILANQEIAAAMASRNVPVIDVYKLLADLSATGDGAAGFEALTGVTGFDDWDVNNDGVGSKSDTQFDNADWHALFADEAHAGSIFQGIFGNLVLYAMNLLNDPAEEDLELMSMEEIFQLAVLEHGDSLNELNGIDFSGFDGDPVFADSFYASYIIYSPDVIPEPTTALLLAAGVGLVGFGRRRRRPA